MEYAIARLQLVLEDDKSELEESIKKHAKGLISSIDHLKNLNNLLARIESLKKAIKVLQEYDNRS